VTHELEGQRRPQVGFEELDVPAALRQHEVTVNFPARCKLVASAIAATGCGFGGQDDLARAVYRARSRHLVVD
jgi:hypothetical protein